MSLENNRKILIGSVIQSLDKRLIIGDTDNESVVLVSVLISYIEYCVKQYNAGNLEYFDKIKKLNKLVHELKYQCPDVCIYRDRLIITKLNTPPHIDDNIIELPISNSHQSLPYNEVIKNYSDAENDLISQVIILSVDNENDLLIDNNPVVINNIYQPNMNFTAKYEHGTGNIFIIKNSDTEPCVPSIIAVNENKYNAALQTHNVVDVNNQDGNAVFQTINNNVKELPNDTIIYIHIDTSSMAKPDQLTIRDVALAWWSDFQTNNPTFEGSMLINTVPNSDISNDYAPGRETNNRVSINSSTIIPGVETWLENPAEGLLRQAWKEGLNHFVNEAAFQDYIQDKSIVVLTFVDETNRPYHGYPDGVTFNDTIQNLYQPTPTYITDYNNYLFKVRPYLRFFKGVLYPITRVNNVVNDNFQLHAMAAIEATTLTPTQIDTLFGTDKVNAYGPTNMQTKFYDNLATSNPYSNLNGLKSSGWEGRFDKTSPASEVLNSQEFADELNDILTDTSNVQVSILETIEIPSENLGNPVETDFSLKVRDNNPQQPLFSNEATIGIRYTSDCEKTPECNGEITHLTTKHKQTYTFTVDDFTDDPSVDKVKILDTIDIPSGQLKYYNLTITSSNTPIVIPIADIDARHLKYIPDNTLQEEDYIQIEHVLSYRDSINYCSQQNYIKLTKLENPNKPPTIVTKDKNIELTLPTETGTTTINTTVTYNGTGGYYTFWSRVSGANDVQMINPTDEDLRLAKLKPGTYQFKITVITIEDNFVVEETSTVTVTAVNQAPTVDAGEDKTIILPTETISIIATESDYENSISSRNWTQESGPNTATITDGTTLTPTFSNLIEGIYVFKIVVIDSGGLTGEDTVQITVST